MMPSKSDLEGWVLDAVRENGGEASVLQVAQSIWRTHEQDLKMSGDLFYTWQYDMRWAAQNLRGAGKLVLSGRNWALK
ncbi:hypothetical protein U879_10235 [Defluviimonas sp. 20V17]|jgi:hypothetical protein|uniref:Uncharacterized protein n=2 Tax=Allgaiera indica TaxID=765699 RepID=A0AAN4UPS0_9RHOB|nr:hypothetical protein [Allgaiera indica]KDB03756.1 hypothetical protein U879_10235 [Defluviimonas sp. 20V17]MDA3887665.1 hypothetical protein [Allgaiera sp.]GHD99999.1 hypothetical protein GCM10008024_09960 [Allgaiera indica]